jgi:iron uptake system component EfeO
MKKTFTIGFLMAFSLAGFAAGCGDDDDSSNNPAGSAGKAGGSGASGGSGAGGAGGGGLSDTEQKALTKSVHALILTEATALKTASTDLCAAAPADAAGWTDAANVNAMQAAWAKTRGPYERIEGVIAPLFPEVDAAIDERYEGFMEGLAAEGGDQNLFDEKGVTGMHAIERILYKDVAGTVLADEAETVGANYKAPAYPASDAEATDFKTKLCAQLVTDTTNLETQWAALKQADGNVIFDLGEAYQGLLDLVAEQKEKVNNASTKLDESRYSQRTMADIRQNLAGVKATYALFSPLLKARPNATNAELDGVAIDAAINAGIVDLQATFTAIIGDAIPQALQEGQRRGRPGDRRLARARARRGGRGARHRAALGHLNS